MPIFTDPFTRADTASGSGLGTIPSGPAWEVVSGSWRILSNRAFSDTAAGSNPIVVVSGGGGDCDVSATVSRDGGDAVYVRVLGASDWLRAKVRKYQTTSTVTTTNTEYLWRGTYSPHSDSSHFATTSTGYGAGTDPNSATFDQWGGSSTSDPTPSAIRVSHFHPHDGGNYTHAHDYQKSSAAFTGQTREVQGTSTQTSTFYQVHLERSVGGGIANLGTVGVGSSLNKIRIRAVGSSVQVFLDGSTNASISVTEGAHSTVARHGLGRATSELLGTNLDDFSFDTVNIAPTAPGTPSVSPNPVATTGTISWPAASDPDGNALTYDVELSTNNGSTFAGIVTGVGGTSTSYNFSGQPATQNARVRVRAKDTFGTYGPYSALSAAFTINRLPTAPTLGTPAAGATQRGGNYTWTHNDTDGQAQASYAFRRTRNGVNEWWNGNAWLTSETYVSTATQSVAFPSAVWGPGTYTWTVSTTDPFGGVSPYAAVRTVIVPGGLSMIV